MNNKFPIRNNIDENMESFMGEGNVKKLLSLLRFQDEFRDEVEKVTPDTYGCESVFVQTFISIEMEQDFPVIANSFYRNVPDALTFENYTYYCDNNIKNSYPVKAFSDFTMMQILSMAKAGNEYSVNLLKYLYKTYYKKEYKVLKKFSVISPSEILSIVEDSNAFEGEFAGVARVLTMCSLYGIELNKDCLFLYMVMDKYNNDIESEKNHEPYSVSPDMIHEAQNALKEAFGVEYLEEIEDDIPDYYKYSRFRRKAYKYLGYDSDFDELQSGGITEEGCYTLTMILLNKLYPNKTFTKEEIQVYASIYYDVQGICGAMDEINNYYQTLMGEIDDYVLEDSMFIPEEFEKVSGIGKPKEVKKHNSNVNAVKEKDTSKDNVKTKAEYKEQDLLAEIENLRSRLHKKEHDANHLSELYRETKKRLEQAEADKDKYSSEHSELVALREHLYNITEDDIVIQESSRQDIINAIKDKKVIIIGGHTNWIQKMKDMFPDWTYINFKSTTTIDDNILNNADHVYFFTDFIKHNVYYRFINIVRDKKIPFGYISSINIDKCLKQMSDDMK